MAFASDSTVAPAPQRGLLRAFARTLALPKSGGMPLDAVEAEFRALVAQPWPSPDQAADNADTLPVQPTGALTAPENTAPEPLLPAADLARAIHLRRQLEVAAEHGAAMLAALGLPRLVGPDFLPFDRTAALDALDAAIDALDALDAPDEDKEPWLCRPCGIGATDSDALFDGEDDSEEDEDDGAAEPSLASPERHPAVPVCFSGGPFTARGGDESQLRWAEGAQHDGEAVNEDGDDLDAGEHDTADHESYLGWPEDVRAVMSTETAVLTADPDAEHDDVDREDGHDAELTHEDGSDDDPHPWQFERPDAVQRAAHLCEVARYGC